jgi:imidazolonepropionase-like amidohydrolase
MSKVLYKGFTLIDGNGNAPVENSYFIVEDKKVVKVGKVSELENTNDVEVVELNGKTVMPGLINAHVHINMEPKGDPFADAQSDAKLAFNTAANLKKHLFAGTTFFRDLGGMNYVDLEARDAVNAGLLEGPEFLAAGKCICMTGGHGWEAGGREADGPDEVRKAAREQLRAGADVIKVMATGGVMTRGVEPGSPQFTEEEMRAAIEEAHKAGRKTSTHAQGTTGIKNAVRAGIDSVEHAFFLDDEVIQMMVERGTYVVPTLVAVDFIVKNGVEAGIPEYAVRKASSTQEAHKASILKAYKAGVKIAMGTDSGTPFNLHGSAPFEVKLMTACGMSPMDALVAATKGSADCLGILDNYGTLEEGKFADFLVLDENPLDNLDTLFNINSVYKLGRKVNR